MPFKLTGLFKASVTYILICLNKFVLILLHKSLRPSFLNGKDNGKASVEKRYKTVCLPDTMDSEIMSQCTYKLSIDLVISGKFGPNPSFLTITLLKPISSAKLPVWKSS